MGSVLYSLCLGYSSVLSYYLYLQNILVQHTTIMKYCWAVYVKVMICGWVINIEVMLTVHCRRQIVKSPP